MIRLSINFCVVGPHTVLHASALWFGLISDVEGETNVWSAGLVEADILLFDLTDYATINARAAQHDAMRWDLPRESAFFPCAHQRIFSARIGELAVEEIK